MGFSPHTSNQRHGACTCCCRLRRHNPPRRRHNTEPHSHRRQRFIWHCSVICSVTRHRVPSVAPAAADASATAGCTGSFVTIMGRRRRLWRKVMSLSHAFVSARSFSLHALLSLIQRPLLSFGSYSQLLSSCLLLHLPSSTWTENALPDMPQVRTAQTQCQDGSVAPPRHRKLL